MIDSYSAVDAPHSWLVQRARVRTLREQAVWEGSSAAAASLAVQLGSSCAVLSPGVTEVDSSAQSLHAHSVACACDCKGMTLQRLSSSQVI